ncbi:MAG: hypothetical protein ACLRZH_17975 [Ruthenibacterium lactatiformans]
MERAKETKEFAEMEMPTGKTIKHCADKGLTQEQLPRPWALRRGVQMGDGQCPADILLLCPLARALGTTPDILLDFRPLLSEEELKAIWEKGRPV